jgi:hypothetical protein
VTASPFYFALEFSSQGVPASLLEALAAQVLGHVGCSRQDVPELTDALGKAAEKTGQPERRCDVQFRAQDGKLEILVSSNGGRLFQISRVLP